MKKTLSLLTALSALTLTATSSDTQLIPNANLTLGQSGIQRWVRVSPAAGKWGTATITVTASESIIASFPSHDVITRTPHESIIATSTIEGYRTEGKC